MSEIDKISYERGKRDGLAGLSPSSTPEAYIKGYTEGRRIRAEQRLNDHCECKRYDD